MKAFKLCRRVLNIVFLCICLCCIFNIHGRNSDTILMKIWFSVDGLDGKYVTFDKSFLKRESALMFYSTTIVTSRTNEKLL